MFFATWLWMIEPLPKSRPLTAAKSDIQLGDTGEEPRKFKMTKHLMFQYALGGRS
jgi:hypothetical protein